MDDLGAVLLVLCVGKHRNLVHVCIKAGIRRPTHIYSGEWNRLTGLLASKTLPKSPGISTWDQSHILELWPVLFRKPLEKLMTVTWEGATWLSSCIDLMAWFNSSNKPACMKWSPGDLRDSSEHLGCQEERGQEEEGAPSQGSSHHEAGRAGSEGQWCWPDIKHDIVRYLCYPEVLPRQVLKMVFLVFYVPQRDNYIYLIKQLINHHTN